MQKILVIVVIRTVILFPQFFILLQVFQFPLLKESVIPNVQYVAGGKISCLIKEHSLKRGVMLNLVFIFYFWQQMLSLDG